MLIECLQYIIGTKMCVTVHRKGDLDILVI